MTDSFNIYNEVDREARQDWLRWGSEEGFYAKPARHTPFRDLDGAPIDNDFDSDPPPEPRSELPVGYEDNYDPGPWYE